MAALAGQTGPAGRAQCYAAQLSSATPHRVGLTRVPAVCPHNNAFCPIPPLHTQLMGPAARWRGRVALLGNGRTGQRVVQQPRGSIGTGRQGWRSVPVPLCHSWAFLRHLCVSVGWGQRPARLAAAVTALSGCGCGVLFPTNTSPHPQPRPPPTRTTPYGAMVAGVRVSWQAGEGGRCRARCLRRHDRVAPTESLCLPRGSRTAVNVLWPEPSDGASDQPGSPPQ